MSGGHSEIWEYIMATREEAVEAEVRISKLEARIAELETRLRDHEQAVPHPESQA